MNPQTVPAVTFHTRVRNPEVPGDNPFEWRDVSSDDIFAGKRVVVFGLPGAFTPACSDSHLPGYERLHDDFIAEGIDQVVCTAVNDAFVMFQWAKALGVEKVTMLPDGNGVFARRMGMLVDRSNQGMGMRSWRYSMLVEDREITQIFAEPDICEIPSSIPMNRSAAEVMLEHIRGGA
ncbi:peroxiredoxin [Citreimonas sp.]|uniref:peroxiredoxin n=1 Tax=Citreimonas sp. TaxID=3036715 RepID=UPI0035C87893